MDVIDAIEMLRDALGNERSFDSPFKEISPSLEQFFADVYYEVASRRSANAFDVFVRLLRLYVRVLSETTNWMISGNRPIGHLGKLLRHELAESNELSIITFNHDLIIEKTISRLPRIEGRWCLQSLYGHPKASELFAPDDVDVFPHCDINPCPHDIPIKLYKLHGSLNWGMRTVSPTPNVGTIFPDQPKSIFILNREQFLDGQVVGKTSKPGGRAWYLWPLIVPPIYDKSKIIGMEFLSSMWNMSAKSIENADRLIVIGYSLPDADATAAQMLRRAFLKNTKLQDVYCINPDPRIAEKMKIRIDAKILKIYHDIETYLIHEIS